MVICVPLVESCYKTISLRLRIRFHYRLDIVHQGYTAYHLRYWIQSIPGSIHRLRE